MSTMDAANVAMLAQQLQMTPMNQNQNNVNQTQNGQNPGVGQNSLSVTPPQQGSGVQNQGGTGQDGNMQQGMVDQMGTPMQTMNAQDPNALEVLRQQQEMIHMLKAQSGADDVNRVNGGGPRQGTPNQGNNQMQPGGSAGNSGKPSTELGMDMGQNTGQEGQVTDPGTPGEMQMTNFFNLMGNTPGGMQQMGNTPGGMAHMGQGMDLQQMFTPGKNFKR